MPRTSPLSLLPVAFAVSVWACTADSSNPASSAQIQCQDYCSSIQKSCVGSNRQYRSEVECAAACGNLPPGDAADRSVNTVGCRLAQAKQATTKDACTAAGAYGGAVCGPNRCDAFCDMVIGSCGKEASPPYKDRGDCLESCAKFRFDPAVGEGPDIAVQSGDNLNCRAHHAILSLESKSHCAHVAVKSSTCFTP